MTMMINFKLEQFAMANIVRIENDTCYHIEFNSRKSKNESWFIPAGFGLTIDVVADNRVLPLNDYYIKWYRDKRLRIPPSEIELYTDGLCVIEALLV